MKITDQYKKGLCPISFEIFPPKGELHPEDARLVLSGLKELSPAYISVTCSAGGTGGSSRKTAELSGIVQNEFGITAAAHITGINAKKADVDAAISDIKAHGISNILALRGDRIEGAEPGDFRYGAEL
ncbi:MAG: methylenetetrahydrofolate reductase, partial [Oscillospiraceae bacterium]|nr:methylenetetrahydrofolate reductase [Oscillospiraceae bacterium]